MGQDEERLGDAQVIKSINVEQRHTARRQRLLKEAAEVQTNGTKSAAGTRSQRNLEATRLRAMAGSALAHAEADARDAGHTEDIETRVIVNRLYLLGTHPMTRNRKAWPAGQAGGTTPGKPGPDQ